MSTRHAMPLRKQIEAYEKSPGEWDWHADANQRTVLARARDHGVRRFEMFSVAPPWWATRSGSPAGADDGGDNLLPSQVEDFGRYVATVARQARDDWGVEFETVEPFNEPSLAVWTATGGQEGCHVTAAAQVPAIRSLRSQLDAVGLHRT